MKCSERTEEEEEEVVVVVQEGIKKATQSGVHIIKIQPEQELKQR